MFDKKSVRFKILIEVSNLGLQNAVSARACGFADFGPHLSHIAGKIQTKVESRKFENYQLNI